MIFTGTKAESNVCMEDSPEKTLRGNCKQFSVEYALRKNYSQLTFSIGADNGDPTYYGDAKPRAVLPRSSCPTRIPGIFSLTPVG